MILGYTTFVSMIKVPYFLLSEVLRILGMQEVEPGYKGFGPMPKRNIQSY